MTDWAKQPFVSIDEAFGDDAKVVRMATQSNKTLAMRARGSLRSRLVNSARGMAIRAIMGYGLRAPKVPAPPSNLPLGMWHGTDGMPLHPTPWTPMSKRDRGLIGFMIRERHGVPFEHNVITFKVITNVRVAREHQRHRIGSFSELSSRWVEMSFWDAYKPERKAIRRQVGKRADYAMEHITSKLVQDLGLAAMWLAYGVSFGMYRLLLKLGWAKELAAYVLPLGMQTEYYWTVNLRSMWNYISLRNDPTALYEIRQIAERVEEQASERYPVCFEMWNQYGRPVV